MLPKRLLSMALAQPHLPSFWGAHGKERLAYTPGAHVDSMERTRELQIPECHGARLLGSPQASWGGDAGYCGPCPDSPKDTQVKVCTNIISAMI